MLNRGFFTPVKDAAARLSFFFFCFTHHPWTIPRVGRHATGISRLGWEGVYAELGRPSLGNAKTPIFLDLVCFNTWPHSITQSLKA